MKTTISVITIIIVFTMTINAQTTIEEYNYVTKGYKTQIESGLDMKKGYELQDIDKTSTGERNVSLKKLMKLNGGTKKTVAYMVTYQKGSGSTEYVCIPNPNSD